jgi:hypothetical protein
VQKIATKILWIGLAILMAQAPTADAHWCSNIYQTYARIVVKPERQAINVGVGETGQLSVKVRNNFPYTLRYIQLRANNPAGLSVTVTPSEADAQNKVIYAGQETTFTLSITRDQAGSDDVADLNLEINTSVQSVGSSWRDAGHWWVDQNPTEADVRNSVQNNPQQTRGLLNADLADVSGCAGCVTDGVQGMLGLYDERVDSCNSSNYDDTSDMQTIRAGLQLSIRLRFGNFTSPSRSAVVADMITAMDDPFDIGRGFAAFLAAFGGNDAGIEARIQSMADSDPEGVCSFSSSSSSQNMAKAALLIMGLNQYQQDVTDCYNNGGEASRARMACAAALGIMGDDGPVTNFLIPEAPNGSNYNYERLTASYLLRLVVLHRRGGPDGVGVVSFLDEDVVVDDVRPLAPTGLVAHAP